MRRLLLLGLLPVLLTVGCARAGASGPQAASLRASGSTSAPVSRDAAIYAVVLRRYLTTPGENSSLDFKTVFVFDYADVNAADPMRTAKSDKAVPISAADQRSVAAALSDVAPVHFVASRDSVVIGGKDGCAVVRDNGILVLLGLPTVAGGQMQVGINGFVACLGATWFTYVVAQNGDGWVVTGKTGPAAIS